MVPSSRTIIFVLNELNFNGILALLGFHSKSSIISGIVNRDMYENDTKYGNTDLRSRVMMIMSPDESLFTNTTSRPLTLCENPSGKLSENSLSADTGKL